MVADPPPARENTALDCAPWPLVLTSGQGAGHVRQESYEMRT